MEGCLATALQSSFPKTYPRKPPSLTLTGAPATLSQPFEEDGLRAPQYF
jgi:hypothetical protein